MIIWIVKIIRIAGIIFAKQICLSHKILQRVGINRLALPVAEQARRFIAPRSARDEGAPSPGTARGGAMGALPVAGGAT